MCGTHYITDANSTALSLTLAKLANQSSVLGCTSTLAFLVGGDYELSHANQTLLSSGTLHLDASSASGAVTLWLETWSLAPFLAVQEGATLQLSNLTVRGLPGATWSTSVLLAQGGAVNASDCAFADFVGHMDSSTDSGVVYVSGTAEVCVPWDDCIGHAYAL